MYVLQRQQQIERIKEMVTLRKNDQTLEVFYHDPRTGEMWKSFFPRRVNGTSGPKVLRPEPLPKNLEQQLDTCLVDALEVDAQGLGTEYSMKPEKWAEILRILKKNRKSYNRSNFFTFLQNLGVLDYSRMLEELHLDAGQFGLTESELQKLQKQAKKLKLRKFLFL